MQKVLLGVLIGFGVGELFNRWEKKVDKEPVVIQPELSEELKKMIDELDLSKIDGSHLVQVKNR